MGQRRWKAPTPKARVAAGVNASAFAATCAQIGPGWPSLGGYIKSCTNLHGCPNATWSAATSEDCLYLNVYAPKIGAASHSKGKGAHRLPVVVFFPAGAFEWGGSDDLSGPCLPRGVHAPSAFYRVNQLSTTFLCGLAGRGA